MNRQKHFFIGGILLLLFSGVPYAALPEANSFFPRFTRAGLKMLFRKYKAPASGVRRRTPPGRYQLEKYPRYREYIANGFRKPANFGGHFRIITWGCGTNCLSGVILDLNTGRILPIPTCEWGIEFRKGSRLLIANPPGNVEKENRKRPGWAKPRYYLWAGGRFHGING